MMPLLTARLRIPTLLTLALLVAVLLALATGCRSRRPPPDRSSAPPVLVSAPDSLPRNLTTSQPPAVTSQPPAVTSQPRRADFAPTPGGERRYIRALKAANTAPRKVKVAQGGQYAPAALEAHNTAAVGKYAAAASDSARLVVAHKEAQAAIAEPGGTVTQTQTPKPGPFAGLLSLSTGLLWLAGGVGALWLIVAVVRRWNDKETA